MNMINAIWHDDLDLRVEILLIIVHINYFNSENTSLEVEEEGLRKNIIKNFAKYAI